MTRHRQMEQQVRVRRGWLVTAAVVVLAVAAVVSVLVTRHRPVASFTVAYEVTGSTSQADLSMQIFAGLSHQSNALPLADPTIGTIQDLAKGSVVYVSVKNDAATGTVACHLKVNGSVVLTQTTSAPFGTAVCTKRLG